MPTKEGTKVKEVTKKVTSKKPQATSTTKI
jgi:hypothetical protein